nr:hypothetical protein CFP56_75157 [Quercus suber]
MPPYHEQGGWSESSSFKEKLIGDIPGAYTQAFNFGDIMEDDEESDEEVENLCEGLVAIKLSKDFKKKIRTPWTRALIVKVYGRVVGLSFLHSRLLSMWKPTGRLDCVDLEHEFFLTRFYLKEDFEATLKRGPWFIGEHFLSIRPWEPNFRLALTNVTSVAVWIRLNGLPIEYYNLEALLQIGKSIGNVRSGGAHVALDNGRLRQEQRKAKTNARFNFTTGRRNLANGPSREAKRKLAPSKQLDQGQASLTQQTQQSLRAKEHRSMGDAIVNEAGPNVDKLGSNVRVEGKIEKTSLNSEGQSSLSVKGKKVIARNKAMIKSTTEVSGSSKTHFNLTSLAPKILCRDEAKHNPSTPFLFSTTTNAEIGNYHQHKRCNREDDRHGDGRKSEEGMSISLGLDLGSEDARDSAQQYHGEGADSKYHGREPGEEKMEVEEGGGASAFP